MKTGTRNLITVAVGIAVLGGAVGALLLTGNKEADNPASAVSTGSIELVSKKSEDIVSMAVSNKKGSYTLVPAAKSSAAASGATAEVTYEVKELKDIPINESAATQAVTNGYSLNATKNLGAVTNLEEYGLKNPQAKVEVKFKDGSTYNYKIGNVSPTDSTAYYMCGENSNTVYIVNIDAGILESKNYFVNKTIFAISSSSGTNDFTALKLSGTNFPGAITIEKNGTENTIISPFRAKTDTTALEKVQSALASLTADSVEAVHPDAAALKSYGLDNPAAIAEFTANKSSYKLLIGARKGSSYYAMLDKGKAVYLIKEDSISAWVRTNAFALRDKTLLMPLITTVKSITVTSGEKISTIAVKRIKDEKKSTESKTEYTYQVTGTGGTAIDYDTNYREFYKKLISVLLLEATDQKPAGKPDVKAEFQYFDKTGTDTLSFYKSGIRRYVAEVNGNVYGVVTSDDVDAITSSLPLLESGKTVN
jgi:hypothetical protein